jgi:uncharacterized protein (TIGR03067 family)
MFAAKLSIVMTLVGAAWGAGVPAGARDTKARDGLLGEWKVVSVELYGKEAPGAEAFKRGAWAITDDRITLTLGRDSVAFGYKVDAGAHSIDLTTLSGPEKGQSYPGIYNLDGDTFTVCYGKGDRPAEFATKPGAEQVLIVFRRQAK